MAITQETVDTSQTDFKDLMKYNKPIHRFLPTVELIKLFGVDIKTEAQSDGLSDVELRGISDSVYDYMISNMPPRNKEILYAKLAENAFNEQETLAIAFGYFALFALRGGDETAHRSGVNFDNGTYVDPAIMEKMSIGIQVKRVLKNGTGLMGSELWFDGEYDFNVEDITDLVYGTDY